MASSRDIAAAMASARRHATATPSTRPHESLRTASSDRDAPRRYNEASHMDESLAQSLRSFESEPEELFSQTIFPTRKALWDGLFSTKQSAKDPTKPWGFFAKLLKWPITTNKVKAKPPLLHKALTRRTLARRSLAPQDHGDLLIVRCVAPPGTLQEYANFAHAHLQMPSANNLPRCTVEVEVSRADDLPQADLLGKSDPFVEIYCGGSKIGRTKTVWKTLNPKWDGEFFKLRNVLTQRDFLQFLNLKLRRRRRRDAAPPRRPRRGRQRDHTLPRRHRSTQVLPGQALPETCCL